MLWRGMDGKLARIAARVAESAENDGIGVFMNKLMEADSAIQNAIGDISSPEGKVIAMGLHQDLFQFMADARQWIRRIRFLAKASPGSVK